jgi:phospholipid/cholesterol/gamma-HCH transport system substrate-binding protein
MKQSRQSFWVGLFVLVGLGALCVLIVLFGQYGFWKSKAGAYVLDVRFERATGIRRGTIVTVGGIAVGRVDSVGFVDPRRLDAGVSVVVAFDRVNFRLHQGARAKTNEPGLGEGRPPIVIIPGDPDAPVLASGSPITGEISSAVESLIPKEIVTNFDKTAMRIGDAAAALTPVLEDLHELLRPRDVAVADQPGGPRGNLATAVQRLDAAFKHWNDVLGDPEVKSQIRTSIDNFYSMTQDGRAVVSEMKAAAADARATAAEAKTLIEQTSGAVTRIDGQVERVAHVLTDDLEMTSNVLTRMYSIVDRIDRGEGTIGQMAVDNRLYESMVLSFRRLAEAVEDFRVLVKEWQKGKVRVAL